MRDAFGGFVEQHGFCGVGAVDEGMQREPEAFPLFGREFAFRELQARAGGDTAAMMAAAAVGFVERRQDGGLEVIGGGLRVEREGGDECEGEAHRLLSYYREPLTAWTGIRENRITTRCA